MKYHKVLAGQALKVLAETKWGGHGNNGCFFCCIDVIQVF